MNEKTMPPVHPGEFLQEELLKPMGITPNSLALRLGVAPARIYEIIAARRSITLDTALRLGKFFDMSHGFWLNLQALYEYQLAQERGDVQRIEKEVRPLLPEEKGAASA